MIKMKLNYFFVIFIAASMVLSCKLQKKENAASDIWTPKDTSWKQLSVREKIGQTMLLRINPKEELTIGNGSYKSFFGLYPIGGFFIHSDVVNHMAKPDSAAAFIRRLVKAYAESSKTPLFIQEDYENGVGGTVKGYTEMPNPMAIGAANDTLLAWNLGKSVALEARSLGMNWLLHPVADLNMHPLNSLVGTRSISDNPDLAIKLLTRQIRAMQKYGVAATIKHFPGDGVDYRDQHMITTENSLSMDEWWKYHGRVFQELINAGASTIMLGHIRLPSFQKEKINGFLPPATLSKELIVDLLKGKMNFKGVVISDALEMGGFQQYYPTRISSQIACFAAGCDVLLWPDYAYMDTLEAKINKKEIPMSRLDDAVARIWALKEKLGLLDKDHPVFGKLIPEDKSLAEQTEKEIAQKAVTLVSNERKSVPFLPGKGKRILFCIVTPNATRHQEVEKFEPTFNALKNLGFLVDTVFHHALVNPSIKETEIYDRMIFAFKREIFNPFSSTILNDTEAFMVWTISSLPQAKVITISYGDPYVHSRYFERVGASVNAYSDDPQTQLAVVNALTGQIPFKGISPVYLHDIRPLKR
jgi:beta-N-acetylhexosaminidase